MTVDRFGLHFGFIWREPHAPRGFNFELSFYRGFWVFYVQVWRTAFIVGPTHKDICTGTHQTEAA